VRVLLAALAGCLAAGCGAGPGDDEAASRGRVLYLAQCTACHATNPGQAGPVGPPITGSSRELIEAKVLRGAYPPGYTPKRPSALMPPMPQLASSIADLAAFLGPR
jgi:mono/diheme cytochrome c family protein